MFVDTIVSDGFSSNNCMLNVSEHAQERGMRVAHDVLARGFEEAAQAGKISLADALLRVEGATWHPRYFQTAAQENALEFCQWAHGRGLVAKVMMHTCAYVRTCTCAFV